MKNKERCNGEDHKMGYSQHCGFTRNSGDTYVNRQQRKCMYKRNAEECLRKNCCRGKASIAYFEGVFSLHYPACRAHVIWWPVWPYHVFFTFIIHGKIFGKKGGIKNKNAYFDFSTNFV